MRKTVDLVKRIAKIKKGNSVGSGIRIVRAITADPAPLTFKFEGTPLALDPNVFEIPVGMYPIREGDRFLAFPILGKGAASRWGLLQKINGCTVNMATMQGPSSLVIDGIGTTYSADRILAPSGLETGDRVAVTAVYDSGVVKYAILQVFK